MFKWFKKNIWADAVWSKVIANGIIFIIAYYFYKFTTSSTDKPATNTPDISFDIFLKRAVDFFQTDNGRYISYGILGIFGMVFIWNIFKIIKAALIKIKFNRFRKSNLWGARIKWKWEEKNGEWKIKYGDYEKICPLCFHNLEFDDINGQYHLKCPNLTCNFRSEIYHIEPPSSSVIIGVDLDTLYFHQALQSTVDAELRKRRIKEYLCF